MDTSFFYKVLSVIHQTQSITAAAEQIGYSQSGLSHAVNRYENEIGFKLLDRDKKKNGVSLTKEALILLPIAQDIEADLNRLHNAIEEIKSAGTGVLTIGTFASVVKQAFPEIIQAFSVKYPNVRLEIKKGSIEQIREWISDQSIDLAITSHQPEDTFEYRKLIDEPMCAIVPRSYDKPVFEIRDMRNYSFIMPANGNLTADRDIQRIFDDHDMIPKTHLSITEWSSIPKLVAVNLGISILPTLMIRGNDDGAACLHIDPPCYRELIVACRSFRHASAPAREFARCAGTVLSDGHLFRLG